MLISAFSRSISRGIAGKALTEFFILVFDVLADQPEQIAVGQLGRIHRRLGIGRVGRRVGILLKAVEAGVPFEVSERPEFLRLCQTGRVQRILNELFANFFDEVLSGTRRR